MKFYVEALLFSKESSSKSFEDWITEFGSDERWSRLWAEPYKKWRRSFWDDTLELDKTKDTDPARQFLDERGLHLKTERGVLDIVRRSWKARPKNTLTAPFRESADAIVARCETTSNGKTIYKIPRFLLEDAADYAERRRRESKRKWASQKAKKRLSGKSVKKNLLS
jgi:hypothetical protein